MSNTHTRLIFIAQICLMASLVAACGTKGPLYIPEQRYPQETNKPSAYDAKNPSNHSAPSTQPIIKE